LSTAYLGLGSNVEAQLNIASGIEALRETFESVELSPFYQTPALGFDGDDFINLAARVVTGMSPLALKHFLHELENRHGRERSVPRFSDRTLDIDILLYDDLWLRSPELEIPRDEILTSPHVLKPLADLAPDLLHPAERRTIASLWAALRVEPETLKRIEL
jgi:2-amino-4-hydroxy-6-hydroxymethyldihydropteridine diphosphokinase